MDEKYVLWLEYGVAALAALVLTILLYAQLYSVLCCVNHKLKPSWPIALAPDWRLFAPYPVHGDRIVLLRKDFGKGPERWSTILAPAERIPLHFLWNPERRAATALFQGENELVKLNIQGAPPAGSEFFKALDRFAQSQCSPAVMAYQFAVLDHSHFPAETRLYAEQAAAQFEVVVTSTMNTRGNRTLAQ
ncbi:hypothetical protein ACVBEQ_15355 [Nakamurella sp. GG22]